MCIDCGRTKTQFISAISQKDGDLVNTMNTVTSGTKLPWAKFPGEMHFSAQFHRTWHKFMRKFKARFNSEKLVSAD